MARANSMNGIGHVEGDDSTIAKWHRLSGTQGVRSLGENSTRSVCLSRKLWLASLPNSVKTDDRQFDIKVSMLCMAL